MTDYRAIKLMHNWEEYCFWGWWFMWAVNYLVVWWGGSWGRWGGGWGAVCVWLKLVWANTEISVWCWWASTVGTVSWLWGWPSCFWDIVALWGCGWQWANYYSCWWDSWSWCIWGKWCYCARNAWWGGGATWNGGNSVSDSYWGNWWTWLCGMWGWGWWATYYPSHEGSSTWVDWWWDWHPTAACPATNCGWGWGWHTCITWCSWAGGDGVVDVCYVADGSYWFTCATWWDCCYTCDWYCVHRFTQDWTFTIVS